MYSLALWVRAWFILGATAHIARFLGDCGLFDGLVGLRLCAELWHWGLLGCICDCAGRYVDYGHA